MQVSARLEQRNSILWFRRDLRITDNPALHAAVASGTNVAPVFVLDDRLLDDSRVAPARAWFLKGSLMALDRSLHALGSGLIVLRGRPETALAQLARRLDVSTVLATRDVTNFSHRRDASVSRALAQVGCELRLLPGLLLAEPEQLLTSTGSGYAVFSPFWRALQKAPRRALVGAPRHIPTPSDWLRSSDGALDERPPTHPGLPVPGETAARGRLDAWVSRGLAHYQEGRNRLSGTATSRLGPDLHLGLISPLQVEIAATEAGDPGGSFVRQIAWREFYHHLLFQRRTSPSMADSPLLSVFRSEADDPEAVAAWRNGRTGIPVVDAGMRQLAATAWLSNRARMVVASFLTRHLLMDHRIGERHFMRHLVDGDVANNTGGWQWTAGVGADPQPWFRIFNPVLQGKRFDADGEWVRQWVPELADIPTAHIHAPWEMPAGVGQAEGVSSAYPRPIVDLKAARERALAAFRSAAGATG